MGFSYKVEPEKTLITVTWDGAFTLDEVNSSLSAMYESADYVPQYKGIADVRSALFLMNLDDLEENHNFVTSHPNHPTGPWAVVCAEPMQTTYAMLYKGKENASHRTEVFSTIAAAEEWLSNQA